MSRDGLHEVGSSHCGDLELQRAANDPVYMTGPAVEVFSGEWNEDVR